MLIDGHKNYGSLIPNLLRLVKDFDISLVMFILSMLLILTQTAHNGFTEDAII
jgi:hypothetical protein